MLSKCLLFVLTNGQLTPEPMWAIAAISAKTWNESFVITGYDSKDDIYRHYNGVYIAVMDNIIDHSTTSNATNDSKCTLLITTPNCS